MLEFQDKTIFIDLLIINDSLIANNTFKTYMHA